MPGTEELMARLQQLEDGYYGDKEAARQQQFFDTYGSRFSNNRGLGLAILNELDARGIDTSAADEAVTQIIDQLRTECNEIIEALKEVQTQAIEQAQKVEDIGNVVSEAVAANPNADDPNALPPEAMPPAEVGDMGIEGMGAEGEFNPDEVPMNNADNADNADMGAEGEFNPDEVPMGDTDNAMSMEEPPEPPAPTDVPSDARIKNIRGALSRVKAKRAAASFKPSAGILNAAMGGR